MKYKAEQPPDLLATLHQYFGFDSFRPGQKAAIERALAGQHTLLVMPTGAGKSLAYQLPALLLPGLTLVISPLIALMKDQVDALLDVDLPATYINSSLPSAEQTRRLRAMQEGHLKLVYVAPERLRANNFVRALAHVPVSLLAVDEAHCVSQWGHDFRPDYLRIRPAWEAWGRPTLLATTATATLQVQADILKLLGAADAQRIMAGFNRPNLTFEVRYTMTEEAKARALHQLLLDIEPQPADVHQDRATGGSLLVYVATRRATEEVAIFIRQVAGLNAQAYHAGLGADLRHQVQDAFMSDRVPVVVATNAFGMGVDKPDIRAVIHYHLPATVEAYYQEAGRAGRDGLPARCVLLYSPDDPSLQAWMIDADTPTLDNLRALHALVTRRAQDGEVLLNHDELADLTGLHPVKVRVALSELEQAGALLHLGDEAGYSRWRLLPLPDGALEARARSIAARAEHRHQLLEYMIGYAESVACRRRYLLDYFGDDSPPAERAIPAECCDNCRASLSLDQLPRAKTAEDWIPLVVLETVRTLPRPIGRQRLAYILAGRAVKGIAAMGYHRHKFYGKLAHLPREEVMAVMDVLVEKRYLALTADRRPVLSLTATGLAALKARAAIPLPAHISSPGHSEEHSSKPQLADEKLFEKLRNWRTAQAHKEGMPAFVIFHDQVLRAIAASFPTDPDQLRGIAGIGAAKLSRYGNAILAIVQAHLAHTSRTSSPPSLERGQAIPELPVDTILAAVADLPGLFSRSGLARLLTGSPSDRVAPYRDHPLYGALSGSCGRKELTTEIDRLIIQGYLVNQQGRLVLSSTGRARLHGEPGQAEPRKNKPSH